jgi:hypothetical protein
MRFFLFLLFATTVGWAQTCPPATVIDDFTTGLTTTPLALRTPNTNVRAFQTGASVLGGVREEYFAIGGNNFKQPAELDIVSDPNGGGALAVTTGTQEFFQLLLYYGVDTHGNTAPLRYLPLPGCDRFRVTFDSSSVGINFNFEVWTPNAAGARASTYFIDGLNTAPATTGSPSCIDFPFTKFGPGQDFQHTGIDMMILILQSASAIGADDFALKKIEFADGTTGNCTIAQ